MDAYQFRVIPYGDAAILIICGLEIHPTTYQRVQRTLQVLKRRRHDIPIRHWVPSYTTILGYLSDTTWSAEAVATHVERIVSGLQTDTPEVIPSERRLIEIPVAYGGEFGPDLVEIAHMRGISEKQFAEMHAAALYQVYLIGFVPGFPYMGGLPEILATPRRREPRIRIPAGSVGIGGSQTGIYPASTPGGWQLIGRTPLTLFDWHRRDAFLLHNGDTVRFRRISPEQYHDIEEQETLRQLEFAHPSRHGTDDSARDASSSFTIVEPGLLTTVQDFGRYGFESEGVARAGMMDSFAGAIANALVGNTVDEAVLECTLIGPKVEFHHEALICITGGDCNPQLNGQAIPMWTTVEVGPRSRLEFGRFQTGCRCYLAVAGGLQAPAVMNSLSTDIGQGFGGFEGRPLRRGDILNYGMRSKPTQFIRGRGVPNRLRPKYGRELTIGFLPTIAPSTLERKAQVQFVEQTWTVTPQSNRMGIRLSGSGVEPHARSVISEPVVPGTIQCPPSGQPIVLMSEAQTVGGYPTFGVVCTADLPLLAQAGPGMNIRFVPIREEEARAKRKHQAELLAWLTRY